MHSQGPVWSSDVAPLPLNYCTLYMHCVLWQTSLLNNSPHLRFIITLALDFVANNGAATLRLFLHFGTMKALHSAFKFNFINSTSCTTFFQFGPRVPAMCTILCSKKPNMAHNTYQHSVHPLQSKCSRSNTAILVTLTLKLVVVMPLPAPTHTVELQMANCSGLNKIQIFTPHFSALLNNAFLYFSWQKFINAEFSNVTYTV